MTARPSVDVVLPIRNEASHIERCLESVLAQDYPAKRMNVLVVDGMSDDGTRAIVADLIERHPDRSIRLIDNPDRIVPSGLNRALRRTKGVVLIRVDGHCEIASDYVSRCVESLERNGADNVGGLQRATGTGTIATAIARAMSSPFGVGSARFRYSERPGLADTVFLGSWRRDVFDVIGGFDEELVRNQDDEFNFRLVQAGGRIWLDPAIRSTYYCRATFRGLWRQYFEYGLYKVRVIQKRGGFSSWRHLVPAVFVLGLLATAILALATGDPLWLVAVAGPYLLASLAVSLRDARSPLRVLLLPAAFAVMHIAYGTGFLAGLWRWRSGWGDRTPVRPLPVPASERPLEP